MIQELAGKAKTPLLDPESDPWERQGAATCHSIITASYSNQRTIAALMVQMSEQKSGHKGYENKEK